jgi:hypothetical protein
VASAIRLSWVQPAEVSLRKRIVSAAWLSRTFLTVSLFLAAITARLLNWMLGALDAQLGPVVPKRGEAGAEAGAAAGGPDVLGGSSVGTIGALASA